MRTIHVATKNCETKMAQKKGVVNFKQEKGKKIKAIEDKTHAEIYKQKHLTKS